MVVRLADEELFDTQGKDEKTVDLDLRKDRSNVIGGFACKGGAGADWELPIVGSVAGAQVDGVPDIVETLRVL